MCPTFVADSVPASKPLVPKLSLPIASGAPSSLEGKRPAALIMTPPPRTNEDGVWTARIDTPRKEVAPLQIFSVRTPPASPKKAVPKENATTRSAGAYVPPWHYGSQWPFCCAPTTLELRGIPRECNIDMLMRLLNDMGFEGRFNFVHVLRRRRGASFALVNCLRHADGRELAGRLHGFCSWPSSGSDSATPLSSRQTARLSRDASCRVSWSYQYQGLQTLIQEFATNEGLERHGSYDEEGRLMGPWVSEACYWTNFPAYYASYYCDDASYQHSSWGEAESNC
eukprot:TRINITY_DN3771_c0_g1_i1.p1 TRINITY_DN3771_c0_g1~~TRINITY_DN3771_c0_g1_i1.p1  ORF type:complete len:283 (-),score=35.44 TRINITY_DN3771_c0_g1_i1:294-1142(-)